MLTACAASWRRAACCLLALTSAVAVAAAATASPASADSVRDAQQWVLDAVDAPAAWPVSQGQGVLVAVIDSGVNPNVSDLAGSVITGPDYSGVDTPPSNPNWGMHGTWMASIIAGHGHGFDSGVSGVAPKATVLSIRVLPDKKDPAYAQYQQEPASRGQHALAKAIRYAVAHRAGVISMSLGYGSASRVVRLALQDALRHKVVVVASAGNSGDAATNRAHAQAPYSFPADYPGVLGVAAVNRAGNPAYFSSDNLSVQVAAPGVRVLAQGNNGQYWEVNGTSPACALTSGVAALIKSAYPGMSPALVVRAIVASAQHPPGGYNDRVGFGTVDAAAALTAAARLTKYVPDGRGLAASSHFGGGPAAIPPPPVRSRGLDQLVLFCLLAVACLAMTATAASRLVLARSAGADTGDQPGQPLAAMRPARSQPDGTAMDQAAMDHAGPGYAGPASTSMNGAGQGGRPAEGSAPGVNTPEPGRHAAPSQWPGIIWPRNRDAATSGEGVTPEQPQPGHGDSE
jgi:subtilisin family serine protease